MPLRLRKGEKEIWPTSQLLRFLTPQKGERTPRAVVLGDPGSGKTTLCRFAAVLLAGEAALEKVAVGDEVLPLFLPFREYVRHCRESGDCGLLAFLEQEAGSRLQVVLPQGFLEAKLETGEAILLLDGLDEVGSAGEREEMRERVLAFGRNYPQVPMLVTSRIAGYTEAPLPENGLDGFAHLHLAPFDDDDLREFVRHWYAIQEAEDPVARDRGVADLLAALEADRHVRELARNPMLATLIALVHRYEAHLPGERAKLYELCVKTLLETWPAARKRTFHEIDFGLQRAYLEALAWRMQTARKAHQRDVTIDRQTLLEVLEAIVRERGDSGIKPAMLEGWVRHLETGTGLLVEQQPGVFAFFHLSLMEYLAACALDAAKEPDEKIARHYADAGWREVCLLAVGRRATDKVFLDRLYERFEALEDAGRWSFLLACLREEAAFGDQQREAILIGVAVAQLHYADPEPIGEAELGRWFGWSLANRLADTSAFNQTIHFSKRHGKRTRDWVEERLRTARGRELEAVIAIQLPEETNIVTILSSRPDADQVAVELCLDHLPPAVSRWVEERIRC
ncbi:MAG: NACHT domain-containing protein [Thermoanaerobaculia bacterium]|nr:NACHT domain-containing protein [Thermoanaerobaculia bacterium]